MSFFKDRNCYLKNYNLSLMDKIRLFSWPFLTLICLVVFIGQSVNAQTYTEQDKNTYYDLFLVGYLNGVNKQIQAYPIANDKKPLLLNFAKQNINKQELMNETWGCVQTKAPTDLVGQGSCFMNWSMKQNRDLIEYIKKINY